MTQTKPIIAHWCNAYNVGDLVTPYIIEQATGSRPIYTEAREGDDVIVGCGSLLNSDRCRAGNRVWGAGVASIADRCDPDANVLAVRGPFSREAVRQSGAIVPDAMGDLALLLPRFLACDTGGDKIGIVPHYTDELRADMLVRESVGTTMISPMQPVESFVRAIGECRFVFSSSLHGLIIADAYGVPNVRMHLGDEVGGDGVKFYDHALAVGRSIDDVADGEAFWAEIDTAQVDQRCVRYREYQTGQFGDLIARAADAVWAVRPKGIDK